MKDVGTYLLKSTRSCVGTKVGQALVGLAQTSDLGFMSFLRLWALHILVEKLAAESEEAIRELCSGVRNQVGVRPFALLARDLRQLDWVRVQEETWQNNGP
jgi:hypothetical protein